MSVRIELHLDGEIYPLHRFSWGFSQGTNSNGMPSSKIRQKGLRLSTVMVRSDDLEAWAYHNNLKKNLEIHIIPNILGAERTRIMKFSECFLIELGTDYHHQSKLQTMQHLFITFGRVETNWSTAVYRENWAQEPIAATQRTVVEDLEPRFIGYHFEDTNGTRVEQEDLEPYQDVVAVIESENALDDTLNINFNDTNLDYKYNGQLLENDILTGVQITGDITRVALSTVPQQTQQA